jgi:IS30 family transposase
MPKTSTDKDAALRLIKAHAGRITVELDKRDRVIRGVHADGIASLREIAAAAGVSHQTIQNIIDRGKN